MSFMSYSPILFPPPIIFPSALLTLLTSISLQGGRRDGVKPTYFNNVYPTAKWTTPMEYINNGAKLLLKFPELETYKYVLVCCCWTLRTKIICFCWTLQSNKDTCYYFLESTKTCAISSYSPTKSIIRHSKKVLKFCARKVQTYH